LLQLLLFVLQTGNRLSIVPDKSNRSCLPSQWRIGFCIHHVQFANQIKHKRYRLIAKDGDINQQQCKPYIYIKQSILQLVEQCIISQFNDAVNLYPFSYLNEQHEQQKYNICHHNKFEGK